MVHKFFMFFITPIIFSLHSKAQYLHYNVFANHTQIGTITAMRQVHDNEVVYESESNMTLYMLLRFEFYSYIKTVFQNGMMMSSNSYSLLNKKPKANALLTVEKNIIM